MIFACCADIETHFALLSCDTIAERFELCLNFLPFELETDFVAMERDSKLNVNKGLTRVGITPNATHL